jgi:hypothetical protein
MERRIIHNDNRPWLREWVAVVQKLLDEVLEHSAISGSLKYP